MLYHCTVRELAFTIENLMYKKKETHITDTSTKNKQTNKLDLLWQCWGAYYDIIKFSICQMAPVICDHV